MIAVQQADINYYVLEMDYTLMALHEALQGDDEIKVFELKDSLEEIRLRLIILGYFS